MRDALLPGLERISAELQEAATYDGPLFNQWFITIALMRKNINASMRQWRE